MNLPLRKDATALAEAPASGRLAKRRHAFLDAATVAFRKKGYAQATLDDIIVHSGGSRQTLYALFGNKEGLFRALVTERSATIYAGMSAETRRDLAPADALLDFGVRYLELCVSPEVIGHYQLVIAEGSRFPEIAKAYWAAGPGHNLDRLANYLAEQADRGNLDLDDPWTAAHSFWGMLQGRVIAEVALGLRPAPDKTEIRAIAGQAVALFLHGCHRDGAARASPKPASAATKGRVKRTNAAKKRR